MTTYRDVAAAVLVLPGVEESTSYGTPALKVAGKLLTRLWEDGETLVLVGIGFDEREMLMAAEPDRFFITEHYRNYPTVLVRLPQVETEAVRALIEPIWRAKAPKRLLKIPLP